MNIEVALEALEKGCCLELYQGGHCMIVDPQAVGFDEKERPMLLGVERSSEQGAPLAQWLLLRLNAFSRVEVSGYLYEVRRSGWSIGKSEFARVLAVQ
jgi:hypothetical protein